MNPQVVVAVIVIDVVIAVARSGILQLMHQIILHLTNRSNQIGLVNDGFGTGTLDSFNLAWFYSSDEGVDHVIAFFAAETAEAGACYYGEAFHAGEAVGGAGGTGGGGGGGCCGGAGCDPARDPVLVGSVIGG